MHDAEARVSQMEAGWSDEQCTGHVPWTLKDRVRRHQRPVSLACTRCSKKRHACGQEREAVRLLPLLGQCVVINPRVRALTFCYRLLRPPSPINGQLTAHPCTFFSAAPELERRPFPPFSVPRSFTWSITHPAAPCTRRQGSYRHIPRAARPSIGDNDCCERRAEILTASLSYLTPRPPNTTASLRYSFTNALAQPSASSSTTTTTATSGCAAV
ncbi:hypothetical protein VTI74DRAFT_9267 [Chaetomium olivicolor]